MPSSDPGLPEKAQIAIPGVDGVPQQIRIDNTLTIEKWRRSDAQKGCAS